ncbi:MAG: diphthamide biosynthesis enzyme Dph2 [Candidatus Aenigmarchaeota archaeon]|nr:diphthamide biosynthesis enzyme Dph2 [Candidatus Aenigmarchaeota archaeon]
MELNDVIKELKKLKAKRVFIQFPLGLKNDKIQKISRTLDDEGIDAVLCIESTYGACDIRDVEAKRLECDAILHVGHVDFGTSSELPVVYWEYFIDSDPVSVLEKEFEKLDGYEKIGLVGSLQYMDKIPEVKEYLEKRGKKVFVAQVEGVKYPGQILGCRLKSGKEIEDKVDAFLCVSAAKFYGLGLILNTNKPMLTLDVERKEITDIAFEKKRIQKIIAWNKSAFKDAKRVGILVSFKKGQMILPYSIKNYLAKKLNKETYILAGDEITQEKIMGLKLDFLVSTLCPRVGTDDTERFEIPMLNFDQIAKIKS